MMGRFDRFNPRANDFVTPEQQAANIQATTKQQRAPRPNQKPPTVRSQGQKRKHSQSNIPHDGDQAAGPQGSKAKHSSSWGERMRKREDTWAKLRPGNSQSAVQYSTLLSEGIQLLQLAAAEHCAVTALCRAIMLHPCLMVVLDADELMLLENSFLEQLEAAMGDRARPAPEQQQQQGPPPQQRQQQQQQQQEPTTQQQHGSLPQQQHQQQQQQGPPPQQQQQQEPASQQQDESAPQQHQHQHQQAQPILQVVGTRLLACHTLGASFWLAVPTVKCRCCNAEWEQQPAAAGFFGSSPVQPWSWFSQQLLELYTPLCTSGGCSISNMAAAIDRANVRIGDAGLKIDPR